MKYNHIDFLRFLIRGNKTFFDVPQEHQAFFLHSLGTPRNDIERSYFQYCCQNFFAPKWKPILLDIVSLIFYIPAIIILLLMGLRIRKKRHIDALTIDLKGMEEIIPDVLSDSYDISFNKWSIKGGLRIGDFPYLMQIFFSHAFSGYFSLKSMVKIAQYSEIISMYSPKCIIAHSEYSFSSSILTEYCEKRGVKHINVQHGEKLFNIVDAFFRFDECFVWSQHYVKLFTDLRAEPSQFKVSLPPSMKIDLSAHKNESVWADYKYYLANFLESQIKGIVESLSFVKKTGKTVKYRIHPRHQNLELLLKYVQSDDIEYPNEVSIVDSLANCNYVVGSYSTVLNQAFCSGRSVLLDDVTFKDQYERLADLRYWLIGENCPRLSEMQ